MAPSGSRTSGCRASTCSTGGALGCCCFSSRSLCCGAPSAITLRECRLRHGGVSAAASRFRGGPLAGRVPHTHPHLNAREGSRMLACAHHAQVCERRQERALQQPPHQRGAPLRRHPRRADGCAAAPLPSAARSGWWLRSARDPAAAHSPVAAGCPLLRSRPPPPDDNACRTAPTRPL